MYYDPMTRMTAEVEKTEYDERYETPEYLWRMQYDYNAGGERVLSQTEKTRYSDGGIDNAATLYIHGMNDYPLIERKMMQPYGEFGTETETIYIYGASGLLCVRNGGSEQYVLKDHLGSTKVVVDGVSRSVVASYDYLPFGGVMRESGSWDKRYRYTGQEYDSELSLYNYRARFYDEDLFRFYSTDPAGEGFSPFAYTGNNPMSFTDPTGEFLQYIPLIAFALGSAVNQGIAAQNRGGNFGSAFGLSLFSSVASFGIGQAASGVVGSVISDEVIGGAVSGALSGGASAAIFGGNIGSGAGFGGLSGLFGGIIAKHSASGGGVELGGYKRSSAERQDISYYIKDGDTYKLHKVVDNFKDFKVFIRGAANGRDDLVIDLQTVDVVGSAPEGFNFKASMAREDALFRTSLNPHTLNKNLFGTHYTGLNNPKTWSGAESRSHTYMSLLDRASYQHDGDYINLGINHPAGGFLDTRTIAADFNFAGRQAMLAGHAMVTNDPILAIQASLSTVFGLDTGLLKSYLVSQKLHIEFKR